MLKFLFAKAQNSERGNPVTSTKPYLCNLLKFNIHEIERFDLVFCNCAYPDLNISTFIYLGS